MVLRGAELHRDNFEVTASYHSLVHRLLAASQSYVTYCNSMCDFTD